MIFKKIDKRSLDAYPANLDFFGIPATQVSIEKMYQREYLPLSSINNLPHQFKILTANAYLIPDSVRVHTTWTLVSKKKEDTAFTPVMKADNIGVINGMGALWIKNANAKLGGQTVSDSNNLYAYLAHKIIQTSFGEESKKSSMHALGWYHSKKGEANTSTNDAWVERNSYVWAKKDTEKEAPEFEYSSPLYLDILMQNKPILSNSELDIVIHPQTKEFLVITPAGSTDEYELTLKDLRITATFMELQPGAALMIEKHLETKDAVYELRRNEMAYQFLDGTKTEVHQVVFATYVPRTLMFVLIDNKAYMGKSDTDGTRCQHGKVRYAQITGGNTTVPSVQWELDWEKNKTIRAFEHFHRTVASIENGLDCGINRYAFENGSTMYYFNLTPSQEDTGNFDFIREGPTIAHIRFNEPVQADGYACIFIGTFDHIVYVNQFRSVSTDLTA